MYPKMMSEVIEAIETHWCDEKDVMIDCMLYLLNAVSDNDDIRTLSKWFKENNLCENCGTELQAQIVKEYHDECGNGVYEYLHEIYCPHCDRGE